MAVYTNDLNATNIQISAGYHKTNAWRYMTNGINIDLNNWVFVTFTCGGSTITSYTHNGTSIVTNTNNINVSTNTPITNKRNYRIGRRWDSAFYIRAEIGEIRLYRRVLTAAEVQDIYNSTRNIYLTKLYLDRFNDPIVHLTGSASKYNTTTRTWVNDGSFGPYFNATVEGTTNIPVLNTASNAIVFDGNKTFTLPNLELGNAWSITMWVRRTGVSTGDQGALICQSVTAPPNNMAIITNSPSLGASDSSQAVAGFYTSGGTWRTTDSLSLPLNTWVHIAYTWDGSRFVSYSNGKCNKIKPTTGTITDTAQDAGSIYLIGRRSDVANYVRADIGEIRIYRRAISKDDVVNICNEKMNKPTGYSTTSGQTPKLPMIRFQASSYSGSGPWTNEGTGGSTYNARIEAGSPSKNGTNSIQLNGSTNFEFDNPQLGGSPFTVSMWIKQTSTGNENACYLTQLVKSYVTSSQWAFGDIYDYYNRSINITISQSQDLSKVIGRYFVGRYVFSRLLQKWATQEEAWYGTNSIDTPTWVHVTYVWDGANFNLYSNGVYMSRITPSRAPEDSGLKYRIGRGWEEVSTYYVNAEIGELRIYKEALSAIEVENIYKENVSSYRTDASECQPLVPIVPALPATDESNNAIINFQAANYNTATNIWYNIGSGGTTYNATMNPVIQLQSSILNQEANGIIFDGSTSFEINNLSLDNTKGWSASIWVKRTGANDAGSCLITQIASGTGTARAINMGVYTNLNENGANAGTDQVGGGFYSQGAWRTPPGANDLPLNRWVHLLYIWDGIKMSCYVNNGYTYGVNIGVSPKDSGQKYRIGRGADESSNKYIRCEIGEIMIYNRAITDRTEISRIYNTNKNIYLTQVYNATTAELPVIKFTAAQINTPDDGGETSGTLTNTGSLGYTYNATLQSGGRFEKNAEGNGIKFNGSTSYRFPNPALGNAWSVCLWIKRTGANGRASCYVSQIYKDGLNNLAVYGNYDVSDLGNSVSDKQISGGFFNHAAFGVSSYNTPAKDLEFNKWVHLTYTWEGRVMRCYLDGVLKDETDIQISSTDSGEQYQIGGDWNRNPTGFITSEIGEIRIYNRMLGGQEVTNIYNETRPTYFIGPVIHLSAMMYPDNDNTAYNFWYNLGSLGGKYSALLEGTKRPDKNIQKNGVVFTASNQSFFKIPNLKLDNAWSVSMWIKRTSNNNPAGASFITQVGGTANYDINNVLQSHAAVNMAVNITGTDISANYFRFGAWRNTNRYTAPLNTWIYLTYTWNGRDYNTYLNGYFINTRRQAFTSSVQVGSSNVSTTDRRSIDSGGEYRIGRGTNLVNSQFDSGGAYLTGEIGQILIYDYAIETAEITRVYDQTKYIYLGEKTMNPCLLLGRASVDGAKRLYSPDECRRLGGKYLAADKCILVDEVSYTLKIERYDSVKYRMVFPIEQHLELYQRFRDKPFFFNKVSTTDTETYIMQFDLFTDSDPNNLYAKISRLVESTIYLTDGFDMGGKDTPIVAYSQVDPIINICKMCATNNTNRAYEAFINSISSLITDRRNTMLTLTNTSIPTRAWYTYNRQTFDRLFKSPLTQMLLRPRSVFECVGLIEIANFINMIGDYIFTTYSQQNVAGYNERSMVIGRAFLTGIYSYFTQFISGIENRIYFTTTVDIFAINKSKESRAFLIQMKFRPTRDCNISSVSTEITRPEFTILRSSTTVSDLFKDPPALSDLLQTLKSSTFTRFTEQLTPGMINTQRVKWGGYPDNELPVSLETCAQQRRFFVNDYRIIELVGTYIYNTYSSTDVAGYNIANPHVGRAFLLGIDSYTFRKSSTETATTSLTLIPRIATITDKYVVTNFTGDNAPFHIVFTMLQPGYDCTDFSDLITNVEYVRNRTKDFYGVASNLTPFPTNIENRPATKAAWEKFFGLSAYPESMTPQSYTKYTGVEIVEKSQDVVFPILRGRDEYGIERRINNAQIDNMSEEGIAQYLKAYSECQMFQIIRDIPGIPYRAILYKNYNLSLRRATSKDVYIRTSSPYKILNDITFTVLKLRNTSSTSCSIGKIGIYGGGAPNTISSTTTIQIVTSTNALRVATATEDASIRALFTYTNINSIWTFDYPTIRGFKLTFGDTPILANGFSFSTGSSSADMDPVQWKLESSSVQDPLENQTSDYTTPTQRLTTVPIFIFGGNNTVTQAAVNPLVPSAGVDFSCTSKFVGGIQNTDVLNMIANKYYEANPIIVDNQEKPSADKPPHSINIFGSIYDRTTQIATFKYNIRNQNTTITYLQDARIETTGVQCNDITVGNPFPITLLTTPSTVSPAAIPPLEKLTETSIRYLRFRPLAVVSGDTVQISKLIFFTSSGDTDVYQPMTTQNATFTNPFSQGDTGVINVLYDGAPPSATKLWNAPIGSYVLIELTTDAARQAAASYTGFTIVKGLDQSAAPKQWALEYSNDGLVWRTLDSQDTDFQPPDDDLSKYFHFYFDKNKLPLDKTAQSMEIVPVTLFDCNDIDCSHPNILSKMRQAFLTSRGTSPNVAFDADPFRIRKIATDRTNKKCIVEFDDATTNARSITAFESDSLRIYCPTKDATNIPFTISQQSSSISYSGAFKPIPRTAGESYKIIRFRPLKLFSSNSTNTNIAKLKLFPRNSNTNIKILNDLFNYSEQSRAAINQPYMTSSYSVSSNQQTWIGEIKQDNIPIGDRIPKGDYVIFTLSLPFTYPSTQPDITLSNIPFKAVMKLNGSELNIPFQSIRTLVSGTDYTGSTTNKTILLESSPVMYRNANDSNSGYNIVLIGQSSNNFSMNADINNQRLRFTFRFCNLKNIYPIQNKRGEPYFVDITGSGESPLNYQPFSVIDYDLIAGSNSGFWVKSDFGELIIRLLTARNDLDSFSLTVGSGTFAPTRWALEYFSETDKVWKVLHLQTTDYYTSSPGTGSETPKLNFQDTVPSFTYNINANAYTSEGFKTEGATVKPQRLIERFYQPSVKPLTHYKENPTLGQRFGIPQTGESALSTLYTLPLKQAASKEAFINRHLDTPATVMNAVQAPRIQQLSYFKYLRFRPLQTRAEGAPVRTGPFVLFDELQKPMEFNARRVKASNPMGTWRGTAADIFGPAAKGTWEDAHRSALIFAFTEPTVFTGLQFLRGTGTGPGPGVPVRWKIEGSQNGTYWETLHDQSRSDFPVGSEGAVTVWF
jgi:hypothetical protein